jgi:hypothetical protein
MLSAGYSFAQNMWTDGNSGLWIDPTDWSFGTVPDGTTDVSILTGAPTLNVSYTNPKTLVVSRAGLQIAGSGGINNTGTTINEILAVVINDGKVTNSGTFINRVSASLANQFGQFTNMSGGFFTNDMSSTITNQASFENASGAMLSNFGTLRNLGFLLNTGTIDNVGVVQNLAAGAELGNAGTLNNFGSLTVSAGRLTNFAILNNASQLSNAADLENRSGAVLNNSATLTNTASITNDVGSTVNVTGTMRNTGNVINDGLMIIRGTLVNQSTISGNVIANAPLSSFTTTTQSNVINTGSMTLFDNSIGGNFRNDGTVSAGLIVTQTGVLSGTGLVHGDVRMAGTMSPGDSPGIFTIMGDYIQASTGIFHEEIGGVLFGQYDELDVAHVLGLGGGLLDVDFVDGFTPALGESWVMIRYGVGSEGKREGQFAFADLPDLPTGMFWELDYNDILGEVLLSIVDQASPTLPPAPPPPSSSVLEPDVLLLLAIALAWIGYHCSIRVRMLETPRLRSCGSHALPEAAFETFAERPSLCENVIVGA